MNTTIERLSRIALTSLVSLSIAAVSSAQQQGKQGFRATELGRNHVRAVEAKYDKPAWQQGVRRTGFPVLSLQLEGWRRGQLMTDGRLLSLPFHEGDNTRPSFVIETIVNDTIAESQDRLIDWLAGIQSPATMPTTETRGIAAGNTGYVGPAQRGENALSWVAFVRGNVAVRLLAVDPNLSGLTMGDLSKQIDMRLKAQPALAADVSMPKAQVSSLNASSSEVTAGEAFELTYAIAAPFATDHKLEWIIGGPGQGYVEVAQSGRRYLYTTAPGSIDLIMQVTAGNGSVTTHSIQLEVLDD
ncbi:MAG: hypothetical protein ACI841_001141 [Planctomycetota bacterium]|jgi:hypothetical protein